MKKRNRILYLVSVIVMLVGVISFTAIPAAADDIIEAYPYPGNSDQEDGYYYIRNVGKEQDNYLAAQKNADGARRFYVQGKGDLFKIKKIQITTADVYAYQIMVIESSVADPGHSIRIPGNNGYPTNGVAIDDGADFNAWFNRWAFDDAGNGRVYIRSYLNMGVHPCLDIDAGTKDGSVGTRLKESNRTSQMWVLEKVNYIPSKLFEGKGTEAEPYRISNKDQLAQIAEYVTNGSDYAGVHFRLTESFLYDGAPIGSEAHPFKGIFDGNHKKIEAKINKNGNNVGLFSCLNGATVKNLEVSGSVKGGGSVGAIAGFAIENTVIDNCHVTADIVGTDANIAGIAGAMDKSTVSNCRMDGSVTSSGWTSFGGIVGGIINDGKIINCVNTGSVTGEKAVGGILGCVLYGNPVIVNCASLGSTIKGTSGDPKEHGGIVGFISQYAESMTIKGCFSNCSVGEEKDSGYLIGNHEGTVPISCENVYYIASGSISGPVGIGNAELNAEKIDEDQLSATVSKLNGYANGKNEAGVAWTAWSQVGNDLLPENCKGFTAATAQPGNTPGTSSIFSQGSIWIIAAVALLAIGGVAALIIVKKKKKPATVKDSEE